MSGIGSRHTQEPIEATVSCSRVTSRRTKKIPIVHSPPQQPMRLLRLGLFSFSPLGTRVYAGMYGVMEKDISWRVDGMVVVFTWP